MRFWIKTTKCNQTPTLIGPNCLRSTDCCAKGRTMDRRLELDAGGMRQNPVLGFSIARGVHSCAGLQGADSPSQPSQTPENDSQEC